METFALVHEMSVWDECEGKTLEEEVEDLLMQIATLFDEDTLNADDASWLFSLFLTSAKNYEGAPQIVLLRLCLKLAETDSDQQALKNYLVAVTTDEIEVEYNQNPTIFSSLKLQHALLLKQKRVDHAQSFALDNIDYEGMRKIAFEHALRPTTMSWLRN